MRKVDDAVSCFKQGMSCSQAILSVYGQELGIDKKTALIISAPFGGGMARMGETCGAATGAFMVIGLKYATGRDAKEQAYSLVKRFVDDFKKSNGSIVCRELLGYDIGTVEGMKVVKEKGAYQYYLPEAGEKCSRNS